MLFRKNYLVIFSEYFKRWYNNKNFYSTKKPFAKKANINSDKVIIKKGNKIITEGSKLSKTFSKHVNIMESTSENKSRLMLLTIIKFLILIKEQNYKSFLGHSSVGHSKWNSLIQHYPCGNEICLATPHKILTLKRRNQKGYRHWLDSTYVMVCYFFVITANE